MCFSAEASFIGGGVILASGLYILKNKKITENNLYFAIIPIIFALHQFIEGGVWLGLNNNWGSTYNYILSFLYVFIAFSFWPIYMPFSVYMMERNNPMRMIIIACIAIGCFVASYFFWCYYLNDELRSSIYCGKTACESISYIFDVPYLKSGKIDLLYLIAINFSFFLSSNKRIRYGIAPLMFISFFIAKAGSVFYTFPSVWCFMGAMGSWIIICVLETKEGK